ncbi:hypothetical protein BRADI_1g25690v3 [Brachypodium distachyon]|uniref:Gnk2-homologous domain-containing protein n=2 Tax=Brachypodium distachyon TaxID=15368 RepID=A0A2K2DL34_BRADI|nr:hypothetical protein BRADI_1g25690v3 [Brachypodium distachyon]
MCSSQQAHGTPYSTKIHFFDSFSAMPQATVLLVLAVFAPLACTAEETNHSMPSRHFCGTQSRYAPDGTYEAKLRLLAAKLAAELVNASSELCPCPTSAHANADQVAAYAYCRRRPDVANASDTCVACIALAFLDARRLCPYHREAMVQRGECQIAFHDAQLREQEDMVDNNRHMSFWKSFWMYNGSVQAVILMLQFQVIGFACLLFLLIQEWRGKKTLRDVI